MIKEEKAIYQIANKELNSLSDLKLLTLMIGNTEDDHKLAYKIYESCQHNIREVANLSMSQLMSFKGIGRTKAARIVAAFTLGLRRELAMTLTRSSIKSSEDAYAIIAPVMLGLAHEEFWTLVLNRSNKVLKRIRHTVGGTSGTVVDSKLLYRQVLEVPRVNSIILCHNHPSGNLSPSKADLDVTSKIVDAGKLLDIKVLDHIIVAEHRYTSFADEGYM